MAQSRIRIAARGVVVRDEKILLVEYRGNEPLHYNLPGGGVEYGETLQQAVQRELVEETCVSCEVQDLLFVYEHMTVTHDDKHSVNFFFRCQIADDANPCMPAKPDIYDHVYQSAIVWFPLSEFADAPLYPHVNQHILDGLQNPTPTHIIETIPLRKFE